MGLLIRILLIAAIILLIISGIRYLLHPKRKLELAHEQKRFYFYDDRIMFGKTFYLLIKGRYLKGKNISVQRMTPLKWYRFLSSRKMSVN